MTMFDVLILAIALSVDATVVSFSQGLMISSERIKSALKLAVAFAFFQAIMPIMGAYLTGFVYSSVQAWGKWIVFAIFLFLGGKFIFEAITKSEDNNEEYCLNSWCILTFAIATSIDAFGAGVSLRLLNVKILIPALLIGIVTFVNSLLGFYASSVLRKMNSKYIEIFGGILLIILAIKSIL